MIRLPDPHGVSDRADFIAFVEGMVASLDAAMLGPEPGPSEDVRGGWTNWINRWVFWEAITAWLADTDRDGLAREPIGRILLEDTPKPRPEHWSDTASLRLFLLSVRDWATGATSAGSPGMWGRAAEALHAGAVYE